MPKALNIRQFRLPLPYYPVNFKEVFTVKTLQFKVNPNLNVVQFINNIRPVLAIHFDINLDDIEIVEAGQYTDKYLPEGAPELIPSNKIIKEIWGEKLQKGTFYVRRKTKVYPQLENFKTFIEDCPICLESSLVAIRYSCSHGVCTECYTRCQSASIRCCSLCRAS